MLNRLSSVLQSAADALAPPPPPIEDLKYHWKLVMRFYAQRTIQSKCPIEETNIPPHLEQLLQILIAEDALTKRAAVEGPCTTAGPCLEFLLQHRLLELLVSLARADSPPGMRRYLLDYLRRFVTAMSPHLLTLASIHLPLLRIITLCSQSEASPTEAEEIGFLLALAHKVHMHPYLSIIFNKETKLNKPSNSSSSVSSNNQVQSDTSAGPGVASSAQSALDANREPSTPDSREGNKINHSISELDGKLLASPPGIEMLSSPNGNNNRECDTSTETEIKDCSVTQKISVSENDSSITNKMAACVTAEDCETTCHSLPTGNSNGDGSARQQSPDSYPSGNNTKGSIPLFDEVFSEHSRTTSGSVTPEPFPLEECSEAEFGEGRLPLLDAVLGYINSADSATKLHVCEALLMMVSVADETFSSAVARSSNLGLAMAEKLTSSFQEIPSDIDPDHFEDIPQNWGPKTLQLWLDQHVFPGSRLIASFVSWLNFCDQLTVDSPEEIAESVASAVRALFFEIELESELRTGDVVRQLLITNIICLSLRHITSNILISELNVWLMGELPEESAQNGDTTLRQLLLNNCLHSNTHLSLNSMRLFELLLENCDEHVLHCLVLRYLTGRDYYSIQSKKDKTQIESWSDEEDAREQEGVKDKQSLDSTGASSRTFAPSNIHKIIDSFLQLLPGSLRSAGDYQESGYHQYIAEAQRQYGINLQVCAPMGWGTEATFPEEKRQSTESPNQTFDEGPFFHMVFSRLRGLAKQPYEMNLQLTALVSRLAMLPHPYVHEFLLNPLLPIVPGATTLYSTLQAVAQEMLSAIAEVPNSKRLLTRTRQELLGDMSYPHEFAGETSCLLESVVVLEEFCKELAAIAYVKYHHAS
ncbi:hypothetical protein ONE63_002960 [Megalurothrips usitatus]|uniref:FHF complex subunit HOOK-interacting protein C-terminal domain-containing protein n=1 Tax=Megalurothrips usitatus TaxID=439358 RepID=A0AAV7XBV3_9NEOP|nr:hypothetical protein ONE63_002960 [Megalurothrips usitatus]